MVDREIVGIERRTNAPPSDPFRCSGSCAGTTPLISTDRGGSGLHAKQLDAAIGRVFGLYCPPRQMTAGSNAIKNDEKVPYLSAVLLALSVRRYVTKRIYGRRGSRVQGYHGSHRLMPPGKYGGRYMPSVSVFPGFFEFFHRRPAFQQVKMTSRPLIT